MRTQTRAGTHTEAGERRGAALHAHELGGDARAHAEAALPSA